MNVRRSSPPSTDVPAVRSCKEIGHESSDVLQTGVRSRTRYSNGEQPMSNELHRVEQQHIRELFLQRQPTYRLSEAARLLGMTRGALEREAKADQADAY